MFKVFNEQASLEEDRWRRRGGMGHGSESVRAERWSGSRGEQVEPGSHTARSICCWARELLRPACVRHFFAVGATVGAKIIGWQRFIRSIAENGITVSHPRV
ncbi:hypothetical protein EYF80_059765 [Liparis tanakae]|uniref:Uncharacterized protein n=1 Tax=Liparis tanakae TaxID=230148 RepID=A0A4Z2EMT9_9TELE|nr:hypothetical protein EYF80_059765 [Liparis tanakae]